MRTHDGDTNPAPDRQGPLITSRELGETKEAVTRLLDALPLRAYFFDVEPRADQWEVRIDFPTHEVWQSLTLSIDPDELRPIAAGQAPPRELLARWRQALGQNNPNPDTPVIGDDTPSPDT